MKNKNKKIKQQVNKKQEEYFIEYILQKKIDKNQINYLIKWKNYDQKDNTLEPEQNIIEDGKEQLQQFDRELQYKIYEELFGDFYENEEEKMISYDQEENESEDKENEEMIEFELEGSLRGFEKEELRKIMGLDAVLDVLQFNDHEDLLFGQFEIDKPREIINHRYGQLTDTRINHLDHHHFHQLTSFKDFKNFIFFKVTWHKRKDNFIPMPSYFSYHQLIKHSYEILQSYMAKIIHHFKFKFDLKDVNPNDLTLLKFLGQI